MQHKRSHRTLSRKPAQRNALLANLTHALLERGSLVTTEAKAKELRTHVEPLITKAKGEMTLHRRRQLLRALHTRHAVQQLIEVASAAANRSGGYVRLTRLPRRRSDNAARMRVELI